ncbi:MAG: SelT/SelW/SelH family protein [bacterium]|nr:SelT/SelW/SelH family protein [bacterium]
MEREFGAQVTLIKGANGVFDVEVDGTQVFSKHSVGRFPDPDEVQRAIRGLGASS